MGGNPEKELVTMKQMIPRTPLFKVFRCARDKLFGIFSRGKIHSSLHLAHTFPVQLQKSDDDNSGERDGSLDREGFLQAGPLDPFDFHVRGHEATHGASHHDPRAHLAAALGVAVQQVRVHRGRGNHDAAHLAGHEDGDDHVVPGALQCEAEHEDRDGHDRRREPNYDEPGFGLDAAGVAAGMVQCDEVVQPVAEDSAENGSNNRGEVEHA